MKLYRMTQMVYSLCLFLAFLAPALAQNNLSKCMFKLRDKLDGVDTSVYGIPQSREIVKNFDFAQGVLSDEAKKRAVIKVYSSWGELADLAGGHLSELGMRGYTRFAGAVIRPDGTHFVDDLIKVFGGKQNFDGPGFDSVMKQLDNTGEWISQLEWRSPGGLVYPVAPAKRQGHRLTHLFTHTIDIERAGGQIHNIFNVERSELLRLIDRAWSKRPPVNESDPGGFLIDMGEEVIGTRGETKILIAINPETGAFISASPRL